MVMELTKRVVVRGKYEPWHTRLRVATVLTSTHMLRIRGASWGAAQSLRTHADDTDYRLVPQTNMTCNLKKHRGECCTKPLTR